MDFCGLLRVFESSQEVRKSEVIRLLGNKAYPHNRKKKESIMRIYYLCRHKKYIIRFSNLSRFYKFWQVMENTENPKNLN